MMPEVGSKWLEPRSNIAIKVTKVTDGFVEYSFTSQTGLSLEADAGVGMWRTWVESGRITPVDPEPSQEQLEELWT